jgi:uncharacterized protein with beta-barrel porin domain
MRSRPPVKQSGAGAVGAIVVAITLGMAALTPAHAQNGLPPPRAPAPTEINSEISAASQVLNLGSNFLERLGNQATNGYDVVLRNNPAGGGASEATEAPPYRGWGEVYGISVTTAPQGDFLGDRRRIVGGVVGFGARIAPGVNIGFSVDQSYTAIDVPLALQTATIDLTQFGFNASVDKGPWTWALALVHGTGNIGSRRDTIFGPATAGYGTQLDGALTELAYFVDLHQGSRIVPKVDLEYVRATTGAFRETGGLDPVAASGAALERARVLAGAELGHYWIFDRKILDLSAYGKFVDNFSQNFNSVLVSFGPQAFAVQGIGEGQYGVDAGASASLSLSNTARIYLNYDGKFRSVLQSHQGTLGVEIKW